MVRLSDAAKEPRRGSATIARRSTPVPFIDTSALEVIERLPGWYGRYFHSPSMTFAHYDFKRGSSIHEHFHLQEEVYEVIEGELELTIDGVKQVARPPHASGRRTSR
jgi:mannose-6-phosphate isomerase-like protein (cupin superfamily)